MANENAQARPLSPVARLIVTVTDPSRTCGGCNGPLDGSEWACSPECEDKILDEFYADQRADEEDEPVDPRDAERDAFLRFVDGEETP